MKRQGAQSSAGVLWAIAQLWKQEYFDPLKLNAEVEESHGCGGLL